MCEIFGLEKGPKALWYTEWYHNLPQSLISLVHHGVHGGIGEKNLAHQLAQGVPKVDVPLAMALHSGEHASYVGSHRPAHPVVCESFVIRQGPLKSLWPLAF